LTDKKKEQLFLDIDLTSFLNMLTNSYISFAKFIPRFKEEQKELRNFYFNNKIFIKKHDWLLYQK
jgi:hypothetical protein